MLCFCDLIIQIFIITFIFTLTLTKTSVMFYYLCLMVMLSYYNLFIESQVLGVILYINYISWQLWVQIYHWKLLLFFLCLASPVACPSFHFMLEKAIMFCLETPYRAKEWTLDSSTKFLNSPIQRMRQPKIQNILCQTEFHIERQLPVLFQLRSLSIGELNHIKLN